MAKKLIVEVNEAELACRLLEAWMGLSRPLGLSAEEALSVDPTAENDTRRMARAALGYFLECVASGQPLAS